MTFIYTSIIDYNKNDNNHIYCYYDEYIRGFYLSQKHSAANKKNIATDHAFDANDAHDLLLGLNQESFNIYIESKFDRKLPMVIYDPFKLFRHIKVAMVTDLVFKTHKELKTADNEYKKSRD